MRKSFVTCVVVAALTLGFMARALTFQAPLFDLHAWRQADTAAISRNFVTERFNVLFPQIDQRGSRADGYVETGLELYAFAVAAIAKVSGFSTALGRVFNAVLFLLAGLTLYRFIRARYDTTTGLVGLSIYAVGLPLTLYIDRAFMNESLLALLTIACLRAAQVYLARARLLPIAVFVVASTLIATIKPTYLIVWGPVVGLFIERYGVRALARPELWLVGAANVAAGVAWFSHARDLGTLTGLSFGVTDKLFSAELLLSAEYVPKIVTRLVKDVLGPVGAVFLVLGAVVATRRGRLAELAGLASFLVYLVVVTVGNFHHNYYQLPIVPIGTVLIAVGITDGVRRFGRTRGWSADRVQLVCAAMVWVAACATFVRSASAHNWYEIDPAIVYLCDETRAKLTPEDRVVIIGNKSPALLFCLNKKGWILSPEEATPDRLGEVSREGADVLVFQEPVAGVESFLSGQTRLDVNVGAFAVYRVSIATVNTIDR